MFDLTGKVAIVTGASSGMGRASAIALANQGAKVVIGARRMDKLEAVAAEIKSLPAQAGHGKEALAVQLDVLKKSDIENIVATTVKTFGHLDILLNDAGALDYSPFLEIKEEKWDLLLDTNLKGYFLMAQTAAREMAKQKYGRIINIASIASGGVGIGFPMLAHYTASKGGVVGLTEAMAGELGPMGITVNAIAPGGINTEMANGGDISPYVNRLAIKRIGKPEEIAAAVIYLASDEAAYTTGITMNIDGGWLAQ
jgi:NAD(P)-dependent dehydrogenase (short-subunit alcohol dehydrogenase family)